MSVWNRFYDWAELTAISIREFLLKWGEEQREAAEEHFFALLDELERRKRIRETRRG